MDLALNNLQWLICHKTKLNPNSNVSHGRIILVLFHEQIALRRDTEWKKVYLTSVCNIASGITVPW